MGNEIQDRKYDLYDNIVKNKNIRLDTKDKLPIIDPLIWPLVRQINRCHLFATTQCCQGHSAKDVLARQIWNYDNTQGSPCDSEAYVSFISPLRLDEFILFKWSISWRIEIEYDNSRRRYIIWWNECDTTQSINFLVSDFLNKFGEDLEIRKIDKEINKIIQGSLLQNPRWGRGAFEIFGDKSKGEENGNKKIFRLAQVFYVGLLENADTFNYVP